MTMDGNFPNISNHFPNPELAAVYELPIALAKKVAADIVLVSDPDADRLGIAVPDRTGEWINLNGNQGAVLMGYFYLKTLFDLQKIPENPVVIKTSVTTALLADIAESFGVEVIGDLLVGFKFIGDRIQNLTAEKSFIFGCEESVGYLFTDAYRDKGAETPAVVAAEMAAWCKLQKITPIDLLESIYKQYGYYAERLYSRVIEGFGAMEKMNNAMTLLRKNFPKRLATKAVVKIIDRQNGVVYDGQTGEVLETRRWDKGDMLSLCFSEDERDVLHIRPSGTEPKMKFYTSLKADLQRTTKVAIENEAEDLEKACTRLFEDLLSGVSVDVSTK
jgi:phosphoglucomutase